MRRSEAGERLQAEILRLEERADLPPRAFGDDEGIWCRKRLKPRRKVRRLADNAPLLRRARADQIADDGEAGGEAEPHLERLRRVQPAGPPR